MKEKIIYFVYDPSKNTTFIFLPITFHYFLLILSVVLCQNYRKHIKERK